MANLKYLDGITCYAEGLQLISHNQSIFDTLSNASPSALEQVGRCNDQTLYKFMKTCHVQKTLLKEVRELQLKIDSEHAFATLIQCMQKYCKTLDVVGLKINK